MKRILFALGLIISSLASFSQSRFPIRADSVVMERVGGSAEFILLNDTRDSTHGLLTNISKGRTAFVKPRVINDSTIIIGLDTFTLRGGIGHSGNVGTVTSFSSGDLSPLFTTSEATVGSTPALTFTLTDAGPYTIFGRNLGTSGVPGYFTPTLASAMFANQGTATTVLHGNAAGNPSWGAVNLAADVTGLLPNANLANSTLGFTLPGTTGLAPNWAASSVALGNNAVLSIPLASAAGVTAGLVSKAKYDEWTAKQDLLISGSNIKTVNGISLLGSTDIVISGTISDGDKGDITVLGDVWTIDSLSMSSLPDVDQNRILARIAPGFGPVSALTGTQITPTLSVFTSDLQGVVPLSGGGTTNFMRADGIWAEPPGGSGTPNTLIGSGFRPILTATQEVKTYFAGYGSLIDSASNTNGLTWKADTVSSNGLVTQYDLTQLSFSTGALQAVALVGNEAAKQIALGGSYNLPQNRNHDYVAEGSKPYQLEVIWNDSAFDAAGQASGAFAVTGYASSAGGGATSIHSRTARGTQYAPESVQNGDRILSIGAKGYVGALSEFSNSTAAILAVATETYTATAQGAYLTIETTPTGTLLRGESIRFNDDATHTVQIASLAGFGSGTVAVDNNGKLSWGSGSGGSKWDNITGGINYSGGTKLGFNVAVPIPTISATVEVDFNTPLMGVGSNANGDGLRTNNTDKAFRLLGMPYANAAVPTTVVIYGTDGGTSTSFLTWGGGTSLANAVTEHYFYAAANSTTLTGTLIMQLTIAGVQINSGSNSFLLPAGRGTSGYVLTTDGAGATSWAAAPGGGGAGTLEEVTDLGNTTNNSIIWNGTGTNRNFQISNLNLADNLIFSQLSPSSGTNVGTIFGLTGKGTGASGIRSEFDLYNTDYTADQTNVEVLGITANGSTGYTFNSVATGTGTVRDVAIQTSSVNRLSISAAGVVTINASTNSFALPTGRGTNGYSLTTDGAGGTAWTNISGGGLSGLTAGRVNFSTSATTISDDGAFLWDNTTKALGIGVSPSSGVDLHIKKSTTGSVWIQGGDGSSDYAEMIFGQATVSLGNYAGFVRETNASGAAGRFMIHNLSHSILFSTSFSGTFREDLLINSSGAVAFNGLFGTSGQVLTSAGSGGPPTWTTVTVNPTLQDVLNNGSTLTTDEDIDVVANRLSVTGSTTGGDATFEVNNTSSGAAIFAHSATGTGVDAQSTSGTALSGLVTSGIGLLVTATTGTPGYFSGNPTTTNSRSVILWLNRNTTGTAANGISGSVEMNLENSDGNSRLAGIIETTWTDVVAASRTSSIKFSTMNSAVETLGMTISGNGDVTLNTGMLIIATQFTPSSSSDATHPIHTLAVDDNFLYYKTGATTWLRQAWSAF